MQIGPYKLSNNVILAPMAGVTDRPFRQLCQRMGAGMTVSEMVSSNALVWGSEKTRRRIEHGGENAPRSVQIVGADAEVMAQAARVNVDHGAQIIDINMGCPAKKICNIAAGSALLRDEALVARILETVVSAVPIPVTLKIRTGWDPAHKNGTTIARIAEQAGVQAIAVHGRTRACGYSGEAEYDTIAAIKAAVSIPVIANGDIRTPQQAKFVLDYTKADAIMIGRAAQGRPWIFREINHYLATGQTLAEPDENQKYEILSEHLQNLYAFYGEYMGVRIARKHVGWYSKGQPGSAEFRHTFNAIETPEQQLAVIKAFFSNRSLREERAA